MNGPRFLVNNSYLATHAFMRSPRIADVLLMCGVGVKCLRSAVNGPSATDWPVIFRLLMPVKKYINLGNGYG